MKVIPSTGSGELYLSVLNRIIGDPKKLSFLDLCCGEMTHTRQMPFRWSLHVDCVDWPNRPPEFQFHKADVSRIHFPEKLFDVCLCSDGIEHLLKPDSRRLIQNMEQWSRKPIIFTPLGDFMVDQNATHPDTHKSGWQPSEFEEIGWKTESYPTWHGALGAFFAWKE